MWKPRRLITLWASTACYRDSFAIISIYLCIYLATHLSIYVSSIYLCIYDGGDDNSVQFLFIYVLAEEPKNQLQCDHEWKK
jgi:hypothetical protein